MSDETLSNESRPDEQVRRIARELKARHGTIDAAALIADEAFLEAVRILEGDSVSDELVAQLARDSGPFVAAIGCEGVRIRGAAPAGWEKKALRRLGQAGPDEAFFHLRALAAAARRNVIPNLTRSGRTCGPCSATGRTRDPRAVPARRPTSARSASTRRPSRGGVGGVARIGA